MSSPRPITLTLDRRILEHPHAHHVRRMRIGLWLYLVLVHRAPADGSAFAIEPGLIARDMGLPEGTIRSWLGHLRKAGYVEARRLNGTVRVAIKHRPAAEKPSQIKPARFFTVQKLQRALNEGGSEEAFEAALNLHTDDTIRRALAGAMAVPETQIRRSRVALFIYLLKRHAHHD